jgi:hypothetical protein
MTEFIFDFIFDPNIHQSEITMTINADTKEKALQRAKNLLTRELKDGLIKTYIHEEIE